MATTKLRKNGLPDLRYGTQEDHIKRVIKDEAEATAYLDQLRKIRSANAMKTRDPKYLAQREERSQREEARKAEKAHLKAMGLSGKM